MGRVRSPKRRVRDDDFIVGYPRISSDYRRIVFLLAEAFRVSPLKSWASRFRGRGSIWWGWRVTLLAPRIGNDVWKWRRSLMTFILRGRRSIWWGWRVTWLPPRIGNDVSYVTQIIHDIHFAWQAQYLVSLQEDFTCSAHWKWRFTCDADHCWLAFCVAGAVFGEVAGWLHFVCALEMKFHSHADHWWCSFCVAGALFGEVGGVTLLAPRTGVVLCS